MKTELQNEHVWLQKLVGEWTYEAEVIIEPDQPPVKNTGTENVRSLDGLWFLAEGQGKMPCSDTVTMITTLGYDPHKQRYVATWIGSMMSHLWVYEGELDATQRVLTLNAEGPAMTGEGMAKYKDAMEFKSDDHRVVTSYILGDDGKWHKCMTANYQRKQ